MKKQKILTILIFITLFIPSISEACSCANSWTHVDVGEPITETLSDDACHQECANRGAKLWNNDFVSLSYNNVTKKPLSATKNDSSVNSSSIPGKYTPMEEIPGFGKLEDFPAYLMAIYKFGLWAIGTSAMFMIMIGGYMYLTSAGNNSQTGKAKGIITDAIAGLILALVSYVLLYTINPELVQFKPLKGITSTSGTTAEVGGTGGTKEGTDKYYKEACPNISSTSPIVFSGANMSLDSNCNKYDSLFNSYGQQYDVDPKILKTIAQIESVCGKLMKSDAGACGLMQLMEDTAHKTCEELLASDALSVESAAKYISNNKSAHGGNVEKILAGYNSGYATTGSGGLALSNDCKDTPGTLKYQCCVKPDELDETIGYVWKGVGVMKKQ